MFQRTFELEIVYQGLFLSLCNGKRVFLGTGSLLGRCCSDCRHGAVLVLGCGLVDYFESQYDLMRRPGAVEDGE